MSKSGDKFDSVDALLAAMVRLNTVNTAASGDSKAEAKLADFNQRIAEAAGFVTRRLPVADRGDNLLVTHTVGADRPWVMFESHMDTVTVGGMVIDPFGGTISDGKMWGRGSCDTKGTGAAMLWALMQYAQGDQQPNNIAIAFTVDEECGMSGVRQLVVDLPSLGFEPLGVIVGEPTGNRPIVTHNGCVRWSVTAHGVAAHSSDPSRGRSAISDIVKVVAAIERDYIPTLTTTDSLTGKAQCSINVIQGGNAFNVIPDTCRIDIDRRIVPGEDATTVVPTVEKLLDALRKVDPQLNVTQQEQFSCPPLGQKHNAQLMAHVQRALGPCDVDIDTQPVGVPYATDGGDLDAAAVPAVVLGPGDIAQAHTKNEFIELSQLHEGVKVYQAIMHTAMQ